MKELVPGQNSGPRIEGGETYLGNLTQYLKVDANGMMTLPAGTATPTQAPLKFTSGVSLAAVEAGAMEFTTDDLYFSITTGPARKGVVLNDGTNLTANRVPYATTNGRLTDGAWLYTAPSTFLVYNTGCFDMLNYTSSAANASTPYAYYGLNLTKTFTAGTPDITSAVRGMYTYLRLNHAATYGDLEGMRTWIRLSNGQIGDASNTGFMYGAVYQVEVAASKTVYRPYIMGAEFGIFNYGIMDGSAGTAGGASSCSGTFTSYSGSSITSMQISAGYYDLYLRSGTTCSGTNNELRGGFFRVRNAVGVTGSMKGVYMIVSAETGHGLTGPMSALDIQVNNQNSTTTTGNVYGISLLQQLGSSTASVVGTMYGIYLSVARNNRLTGSGYGIFITRSGSTQPSGGHTHLWIEDGGISCLWGIRYTGTSPSAIDGSISIRTTVTPTAYLHIGAGTSAASTAPLKLTAGTLLGTVEAGAIEFDGDYFYSSSGVMTGITHRRRVVSDDRVVVFNDEGIYIDDNLVLL